MLFFYFPIFSISSKVLKMQLGYRTGWSELYCPNIGEQRDEASNRTIRSNGGWLYKVPVLIVRKIFNTRYLLNFYCNIIRLIIGSSPPFPALQFHDTTTKPGAANEINIGLSGNMYQKAFM